MAEKSDLVMRRSKGNPSRSYDERPISFELKTDFANTETKLVVLDFLSSQPIEHLTARNAVKRETKSFNERRRKTSLDKSNSDGSNHQDYRSRYAKLAKSGKTLRKQYSLRLKRDLDEYLKLRGQSMDNLSFEDSQTGLQDEGLGEYQHQRSYTEGETYFRLRSRSPIRNQAASPTKPRRKISQELKEGIREFDPQTLNHVEVEVEEVSRAVESVSDVR